MTDNSQSSPSPQPAVRSRLGCMSYLCVAIVLLVGLVVAMQSGVRYYYYRQATSGLSAAEAQAFRAWLDAPINALELPAAPALDDEIHITTELDTVGSVVRAALSADKRIVQVPVTDQIYVRTTRGQELSQEELLILEKLSAEMEQVFPRLQALVAHPDYRLNMRNHPAPQRKVTGQSLVQTSLALYGLVLARAQRTAEALQVLQVSMDLCKHDPLGYPVLLKLQLINHVRVMRLAKEIADRTADAGHLQRLHSLMQTYRDHQLSPAPESLEHLDVARAHAMMVADGYLDETPMRNEDMQILLMWHYNDYMAWLEKTLPPESPRKPHIQYQQLRGNRWELIVYNLNDGPGRLLVGPVVHAWSVEGMLAGWKFEQEIADDYAKARKEVNQFLNDLRKQME